MNSFEIEEIERNFFGLWTKTYRHGCQNSLVCNRKIILGKNFERIFKFLTIFIGFLGMKSVLERQKLRRSYPNWILRVQRNTLTERFEFFLIFPELKWKLFTSREFFSVGLSRRHSWCPGNILSENKFARSCAFDAAGIDKSRKKVYILKKWFSFTKTWRRKNFFS